MVHKSMDTIVKGRDLLKKKTKRHPFLCRVLKQKETDFLWKETMENRPKILYISSNLLNSVF